MELAYKSFEFRVPSRILYGVGCAKEAGSVAKALGGTKALIVTDPVLRKMGYPKEVQGYLEEAGLRVEVFDGVPTEPEMGYVEKGLKIYEEAGCDLTVAVGGGSPIDTAKGIALLATNKGSMRDYEGIGKIPVPAAPLIAMPTTAGTGSEVTQFTVITDVERKRKMLIGSPNIIPTAAICDPLFTLKLPPDYTMGIGVDALTHAIEAYVSVKAQPLSDMFALNAIELISRSLRQAWADGSNLAARSNMMRAATEAGIAFSNSSVALVHGMSRPIGAHFHLPHGLSNAILLPHVMEFSYIGNPEKFADIAVAMGESVEDLSVLDAAIVAVETVGRLCEDVGVPTLVGAGCEEAKVLELAPKMADDAIASGSPANNPRKPTREQIVEIYKRAL
ncbi:MAG: iron-containing alcohol dehydrogenase [Candidatus Geothermarchaeales archaeon]